MSKTFTLAEMLAHNGRIAADLTNDMEDWDRTFSRDMQVRYERYGTNMFLSTKQETHVNRIFRTTGGQSAPVPVAKQDKHGFDNANSDDDIPF